MADQKGTIRIDEFYTVEYDHISWDLVYMKEKVVAGKDKPEVTRRTTYHPNLAQALTQYLHMSLIGSETIESVVEAIAAAEDRIEKLVQEIKEQLR